MNGQWARRLRTSMQELLTLYCAHAQQGRDAKELLDAAPHVVVRVSGLGGGGGGGGGRAEVGCGWGRRRAVVGVGQLPVSLAASRVFWIRNFWPLPQHTCSCCNAGHGVSASYLGPVHEAQRGHSQPPRPLRGQLQRPLQLIYALASLPPTIPLRVAVGLPRHLYDKGVHP